MKKIFTIIAAAVLFTSCKKASISNKGLGTLYITATAQSGGGNTEVRFAILDKNRQPISSPADITIIASVPLNGGNILDTAMILSNYSYVYSQLNGSVGNTVECHIVNATATGYTFTYQ